MAVTLRKHAELCKFGLVPSSSVRQSGEPFLGVCVDTGTTRTMVGSSQFRALCIVMGYTPKLRSSSRRFRCGNLTHPSLGYFSFRLPIGKSHFHSIDVDVVDVSNPFLLGLNDLHAIQARIDLSDFSWTIAGERSKLVHKNQHLWLPLSFDDSCCFTQAELTLLHRRLGHPQADRMLALLRRAKPLDIDKDTKKQLDEIWASCGSCQRTRPKPFVFRAAIPDEVVFGHELIIDLAKCDGKYILHCVDRGTGLNAAKFVSGESARDIWDALLEIWITKYVTPDVITTDAGSAFISKQFQDHVETFGTLIRAVPVEAHSSLNRGEQAHGPLRRVFEKLKEERGLSDDTRLALAVKAINEMPNVQGFTPLQLVYGVIPKIPIGIHSPYIRQKERLEALRKARDEYATYIAQRRLKIAQDVRGPGESDLREGDLALVFREESKRWEGPGRVVSLDAGNVAHILLKGGKVTPFSITCFRRFPPLDTPKVSYVSTSNSETHDQEVLHRTETALNQYDARFDDAKKIELQQLLDRGTFTPVLKKNRPA
jgi:transposase InsO family protein